MYMYIYTLYIYIYIYIYTHVCISGPSGYELEQYMAGSLVIIRRRRLRPTSLLRLSLLRFFDCNISGEFPMDMRIPRLQIKILLGSNSESRILVQRSDGSDGSFSRCSCRV